jgi:hypothetical protein
MPLIRRIVWLWTLFPLLAAGLLGWVGWKPGLLPDWAGIVGLMLIVATGAALWGMRAVYASWSVAPSPLEVAAPLAPPEPVAFVSRGGFVTPGVAVLAPTELVLYAKAARILSIPYANVAKVKAFRGALLRTPYLDLVTPEGTRVARLAVESAARWAELLTATLSSGH